MNKLISRFFKQEDGAVTVDWVVLTAAIVGLSVSAYAGMSDASDALTENTSTTMGGFTVGAVTLADDE